MNHTHPPLSTNSVNGILPDSPKLPPACPQCGRKPIIDKYGTLQICGHFYGGGKNGRYYLFTNLEDVVKFEKGEE